MPPNAQQLRGYADVLVRTALGLREGQGLLLRAELAHREFAHLVVEAAYDAGASLVVVDWQDQRVNHARYARSRPGYLDRVPAGMIAQYHQLVDEGWALLNLTGEELPGLLDDVDPAAISRAGQARAKATEFYRNGVMAPLFAWTIGGVPTAAWARQVFPALSETEGMDALWGDLLRMARADQPDPAAAWAAHAARMGVVRASLERERIRALRFEDATPAADGSPCTRLMIGLTDAPIWTSVLFTLPDGRTSIPNVPTEEVFTSPHRLKAEGWARTSRPGFPLGREASGAYFRFAGGELAEWRAEVGQDALDAYFKIPGTRRLGEVALVEVSSPVGASGRVYRNTLYDENAAIHIAFGQSITAGYAGAGAMTAEAREAAGLNQADDHLDLMLGTPTMGVAGIRADGSEIPVMVHGRFAAEMLVSG